MDFNLFRDGKYVVESNQELHRGDVVYLVNENCEFPFDSSTGCFERNCNYEYEAQVIITNEDLSEYQVEKSNNGGAYGFAKGVIVEITPF